MPISGKEMIVMFEKNGWAKISQQGSHVKMRKGNLTVIIPLHKELKKGLEASLLKTLSGANSG